MNHNSISELAKAWKTEHPKRARGGVVSIVGFRYQFHCVLRDAVRAWIDDRSAVAPSTEVLSDVLSKTDGVWTITQVKRTGTSGTLHKALEELWTIECVAQSEFPHLLHSLRYEVRCAQWELSNIRKSIDAWTPGKLANSSGTMLREFKARVSPSWVPRPFDELTSMLVKDCRAKNALEWIDTWTSRLTGTSVGDRTPEIYGKELYDSLRQLTDEARPQLPLGIQSVPPDFTEPVSITTGAHLVGQQPRLRHLVDGFFAPRKWQVEPVSQAFQEWIESDPFGSDTGRRLPVFWISGPSGSGKSVLLLQLLARLSQLGIGPMLWLGNKRILLPDAVEWAVLATNRQVQSYIAIDDPYAPGEQGNAGLHWQNVIGKLESVRDKENLIPIILACGPAEQAHSFQQELESDVLVRLWTIDAKADTENLQNLMDWFEKRTGKKPPDTGNGEILMVQRFFEWRTGEELSQFSQRFRGRVEALSNTGELTQLVSELLAVNRLYAGLPEQVIGCLRDHDRDALEPLKRDHHIMINRDGGRPGLWLAHPHLADALFQGWFGKATRHQRSGALRDGIVTCLQSGSTPTEQTAPLWALSRALVAGDEAPLVQRFDYDDTVAVLENVFPYFCDEQGQLSFSHLAIWSPQ